MKNDKSKTVEVSQIVTLFPDSEKEGKQFANYDPEDNWIVVTHDGESISLSVENWQKLKELADIAQNSK